MHKKPACAVSLEQNLEELRRRQLLEALRPYVLHDEAEKARKAPITVDDLKALCRMWKMDQRRNFWRLHPTQHDLVMALHEYIQENMRFTHPNADRTTASTTAIPKEPGVSKSSRFNVDESPRKRLANYFGHGVPFDKCLTERELVLRSRFMNAPGKTEVEENSLQVKIMRRRKSARRRSSPGPLQEGEIRRSKDAIYALQAIQFRSLQREVETDFIRAKVLKHRTLAGHLVRFSARKDIDLGSLPVKAIKVFLTLTVSQDPLTVTRGLMALSNIASDRFVRSVLIKDNALQTITSLAPSVEGQWFVTLIFYYFSCDADLDESVGSIYQAMKRISTESVEMRLIVLETLNNILASTERQKAMELIMTNLGTLLGDIEPDLAENSKIFAVILETLANLCSFVHMQATLLEYGVLNIIGKIRHLATSVDGTDLISLRHKISNILSSFLHAKEIFHALLDFTFVEFLAENLGLDEPLCLQTVLHAIAVLSSNEKNALYLSTLPLIFEILQLVESHPVEANSIYYRFFSLMVSNITRYYSVENMESIGNIYMPFLIPLIKYYSYENIGKYSIQSIVNLLNVDSMCEFYIKECCGLLLDVVDKNEETEAAKCIFNFCLVPSCLTHLVDHSIHIALFSKLIVHHPNSEFIRVILQIYMHLITDTRCLHFLLSNELILRLHQMSLKDDTIWLDVSRLMRILISLSAIDDETRGVVLQILILFCSKETDFDISDILVECSMILAYLGLSIPDFSHMDSVIKAIISISDNSNVMESLANLLYNVASTATPSSILLEDMYYLNVMIRMLRAGMSKIAA